MLESLLRARLVYGAVAMSAGMFVFSFLQEREELEDQELESAERPVSTELFFQAMENMPQLSPQQRLEMRRFWRNLTNKKQQRRLSISSDSSAGLDAEDEVHSAELVMRDVQLFAQEYKRVFPDIFPEQQVLDAAERAADAAEQLPTAWGGIVDSTSTMIKSTGKRLNHIAKDTKDEVQFAMHRTVRKVLESALDIVAAKLKQTLKDPDMPSYLKTNIDIGIEQFMPDVKMEIFRKTRELFGQDSGPSELKKTVKGNKDGGGATTSGHGASVVPVTSKRFEPFRRIRGHVLHHLFPHDKTIWRSFKDPWWIAYTSVGILPVVGQLWWIFLFIMKDKTNEHQLCQFIVGFKAAQFITLGIMHMIFGILVYVKCVVQGSMLACQKGGGPALSEGTACFFVLQIVLVWAAFFRLPYTERPQETTLYRTKSMELRERGVFHDAFGNEVHLNRGGYLMKFCGYETVSFIVIMALAGLVLWLPFESWQRQTLFYWIRTAYGLFSFPFLVFKIPVLANVLMHTRQMGYNEQGDTVRFVKKPLE
ncbi:Hypothetical protein PHPALM_9760 [Phytophthora palmivora]|uniref:Transmembrane protein n=1 Tax=Phytophthora palmivora TaxID=4796 RepID=A0A2P4Y6F8_9STRA|nr:Hypothetical protein PHPALM_9760 [Phytophthora palmivora]